MGDATMMHGSSTGGNDTLQGGNNSGKILINGLFGDAALMLESLKVAMTSCRAVTTMVEFLLRG